MKYNFILLLTLFCFLKTGFCKAQTTASSYYQKATEFIKTDLDSALFYAEEGLDLAQQQKDYENVIEGYLNKGIIYKEKADADKSMNFFLSAIETQEKYFPQQSLAEIYNEIAILFYVEREYQESENYLKKALEEAENPDKIQDEGVVYDVYFSLATLYSRLKDFEKSRFYFDQSLKEPDLSPIDITSVYLNKGNMFQRQKALDSAEISYQKAIKTLTESSEKDNKLLGRIYNSLTDVALKTGRYDLAQEYGSKGLAYAEETQNLRSAIYAYRNLGYAYYLREDYKDAFEVQAKARKLRDSLSQMTNRKILNELEQKYQNEKKQREIERLTQEKILSEEREKASKTRTILFFIIALITVIALVLILQIQKVRHRKNISIQEQKQHIQKLELREKEQQIEQYEEQLHRHTNNLLQKNLVLSELREELSTLKESKTEEEQFKRQKMEQLINSKILTEEDWQNYKQIFLRVYPSFFQKLKDISPKISKAEKRIATLLKLGLSQYEMATILGISEESVRKGKYRLRQRLEVDSEEKAIDILKNID